MSAPHGAATATDLVRRLEREEQEVAADLDDLEQERGELESYADTVGTALTSIRQILAAVPARPRRSGPAPRRQPVEVVYGIQGQGPRMVTPGGRTSAPAEPQPEQSPAVEKPRAAKRRPVCCYCGAAPAPYSLDGKMGHELCASCHRSPAEGGPSIADVRARLVEREAASESPVVEKAPDTQPSVRDAAKAEPETAAERARAWLRAQPFGATFGAAGLAQATGQIPQRAWAMLSLWHTQGRVERLSKGVYRRAHRTAEAAE